MTLAKLKSNSLALLLGVVIAAALLMSAEGGARLHEAYLGEPERETKTKLRRKKYRAPDEFGIYRISPGRHRSHKYYNDNGETIYRVVYTVDELGRRVVPVPEARSRDRHLIFSGGSFTYGEGVDDRETLPYQVGIGTTRYKPYIYAFHGWGPTMCWQNSGTMT